MINWVGLYTFIRRETERFLRVTIQTLITPWISALLYIFIFGHVIGKRIDFMAGVEYIDFVLPGLIMMNIIMSSFSQTSSSLYFQRFARHIEEVLVAPLSYLEMIIGYVIGGVVRSMIVGLGVFFIAVFFSAANLDNFLLFLFYSLSVAVVFAFIGLLVGLWAKHFEHLAVLNTFVIMPLSFLGGIFNSITMLPPALQTVVKFNPFFYFIDGLRYSMIGIQEANAVIGLFVIFSLIICLGCLVWYLFKIGYKIRE
ncbi:ABC transporter permease [Patescibacteria group bacterium]